MNDNKYEFVFIGKTCKMMMNWILENEQSKKCKKNCCVKKSK